MSRRGRNPFSASYLYLNLLWKEVTICSGNFNINIFKHQFLPPLLPRVLPLVTAPLSLVNCRLSRAIEFLFSSCMLIRGDKEFRLMASLPFRGRRQGKRRDGNSGKTETRLSVDSRFFQIVGTVLLQREGKTHPGMDQIDLCHWFSKSSVFAKSYYTEPSLVPVSMNKQADVSNTECNGTQKEFTSNKFFH